MCKIISRLNHYFTCKSKKYFIVLFFIHHLINCLWNGSIGSVLLKQLTHWGRDKMAAIFQTTFENGFSWMKIYEVRLRFHWSFFLGAQSPYSSIGSYNGLTPTRRQAIIWINDGYISPMHMWVTQPQWVKQTFAKSLLQCMVLRKMIEPVLIILNGK